MNFDSFVPVCRDVAIPVSDLDQAVAWINKEAPELEDLNPEQLRAVVRLVLVNRLARDLDRRTAMADINYAAEKIVFLDNAGRIKSGHTRKAYAASLTGLESFAAKSNITVPELSPKLADNFPPELIRFLREAGLDTRVPFAGYTAGSISERIKITTRKLYQAREIADAFSIHDFRHLFAVTEYRKNREIYHLSKLLHHSGIQTTERYLRGLGEVE